MRNLPLTRTAGIVLVQLMLAACLGDSTPNGFQRYRLGASREKLAEAMSTAHPMTLSQRLLYGFLIQEFDDVDVTRWVDRASVSSGHSVTVLSTFYRSRLARIDVVYPPTAARGDCAMCAALRDQYGPSTSADTTGFVRTQRWTKWNCCELRVTDARIALVLSYVGLDASTQRVKAEEREQIRAGRAQLQ